VGWENRLCVSFSSTCGCPFLKRSSLISKLSFSYSSCSLPVSCLFQVDMCIRALRAVVTIVFNICCCVVGAGGAGGGGEEGELVEVRLTLSRKDLFRLCTALQNEFSDDSLKISLKYRSKFSSIKEILSSLPAVVPSHLQHCDAFRRTQTSS